MLNHLTRVGGVCAASCLSFFLAAAAAAQEDVVATVNGHEITLPEFRRSLLEHRAAVFGYFKRQFGAEDHREFWTSSFEGEVPLEMLRSQTLDDCIRIKVQQLLALEKGLLHNVSYPTFLRGLSEENVRRKEAVRNHKVIYGPVEFSEDTGFTHSFGQLVVRLKKRLAEDDFVITETTLRDFYDEHKEQFKRQPDSVGYYPFDKMQRVLKRRYIDRAYEVLVAQRVAEAEVVVNEAVYGETQAD